MGKNKLHNKEKEKAPTSLQLHQGSRLEGNGKVVRKTRILQAKGAVPVKQRSHNPYEKPDMPYQQLIIQALLASPSCSLSLRDIYTWIEVTYPYYLHDQNKSWKNSVRHNLSIQKAFKKVPREPESGEKSCLWELTSETGTKRKLLTRRASEPLTILASPIHHPLNFRPIRAMPIPPVEKLESPKPRKKRRSSEPTVHTEPVPILPKPLVFEDQPVRITSPMLQNSQSMDDSWLTPDFYSTPFPYSQLNIDEYLYHQPPWMNKPERTPSQQNPSQSQDDVLQQQSNQLFTNLPIDMITGRE